MPRHGRPVQHLQRANRSAQISQASLSMDLPSSILFQNESKSIILLDLPRSIEESQVLPHVALRLGENQPDLRLRSVKPLQCPFPTPEPRFGQATQSAPTPSAQVSELMTSAAVAAALEELRVSYNGPWCLPRLEAEPDGRGESPTRQHPGTAMVTSPRDELAQFLVPPNSRYLLGSLESQRQAFISEAPIFDLIVLDPPWPNRSARRKKRSYQTANDQQSIKDLLSLVPVASHLASDGLVAVWVTNAARFSELLTSPRGIFAEWGVELIDEWTWLKVTAGGEPIVSLDSLWRKPWERLLVAARRGSHRRMELQGKVILAVPELHSRKPSLRGLFDQILPPGYKGLEIFARHLTAGWWCWGDEATRFQHRDYWVGPEQVAGGFNEEPTGIGKPEEPLDR